LGQRINIQYTIEINELEEEVKRLIIKNISNFETIIEKITSVHEGSLLSHGTLDDLDLIRQEMARVDMRMIDCVNIIEGYLQYRSQLKAEPFPEEALEQATMTEGDLSHLKEKIGKFKEAAADEVSD
tara:strand:- start:891 stop:1271 length:381 start_codon:yes stop_codon:yes gene_type:complete